MSIFFMSANISKMVKRYFFLFLVSFVMIVFHSCENEGTVPGIIEFIVSPNTLFISDQDSVGEVFISTKPALKCDFVITQKPDWLTITPSSGIINGNIIKLTVKPNRAGLSQGTYSGDISIISNTAGTEEIEVFMTSGVHPKMVIEPLSINFHQNASYADLMIRNTGTGSLIWSFSNYPKWLSFSSNYGIIESGSTRIVRINCIRSGLDVATYTGSITINSNSEISIKPIQVSLQISTLTSIGVPVSLTFSELTEKLNFIVENTGNTSVSWSAVQGNYLTLSATSGVLSKGESKTIEATVDRTSLQTGTYTSSINFNYGSGETVSVPVLIKHYPQTKWFIEGTVKDAEFCRATNRIILVTTNPNRLSIIDPDTKTIEHVNLNSLPKCVAVNKNGDKAVVGHDGMITYINISEKSLEKERSIACDVLDIVITSTNWVYAFPARDQWTRIFCVNPLNWNVTQHTGNSIYAGTLGRLHPSEKWIYGADNGLSPSDIEKYNIESGTAVFNYDSPYHGTYPMNGNLWFSADGQRIFTRGRTVLKATSEKTSDMEYNGSVPGTNDIWTLFHTGMTDRIYFTTYTRNYVSYAVIPASEVSVCNYTYLTFLKSYPLEKFIVPDDILVTRTCNAEGHYVFTNEEGTKLYVIIKADNTSGLINDWAIQNIDIN